MNRTAKLLLFGTGVASIAALALTSACSSRRVDLLSQGGEALDRTETNAREAMVLHPERVDETLVRFRELFDNFRPGTVSELARNLYAPGAYFNDGFVELTDTDELAHYFERSAEHTAEIEVVIEEITKTESGVYVRWVMTFTTTGGTTVVAPGISHLRFNPDGLIIYHRDYWDAGSALAELIPFTGSLLRAVKARI